MIERTSPAPLTIVLSRPMTQEIHQILSHHWDRIKMFSLSRTNNPPATSSDGTWTWDIADRSAHLKFENLHVLKILRVREIEDDLLALFDTLATRTQKISLCLVQMTFSGCLRLLTNPIVNQLLGLDLHCGKLTPFYSTMLISNRYRREYTLGYTLCLTAT